MTKFALVAASISLILAGASAATAQTTPAPIKVSVVPETVRAGGAAGYPAQPGLFDRLLSDLGIAKTNNESATNPAGTEAQAEDPH